MDLHDSDASKLISDNGTTYLLLDPEPLPEGTQGPTAFLGKGEFGSVSIALTEDLTPLAVKKIALDKKSPTYAATMAEIEKETRIMRHLQRQADLIVRNTNDPNQVEIFVIQPFIAGIELKNFFEDLNTKAALKNTDAIHKLNLLKEAITSWIATMEATLQLHHANIIHGDLHTGNVLYDPITKQATIIDFGMSHQLEPGQEKSYTTEEALMAGLHRAPETRRLELRREGHPPERVYDKSSDIYSLAINFGIDSEFSEKYAPQEANNEVNQIMDLCKALSQEGMLGGNNDPSQRISLAEGITRLKAIQSQIDLRILQKMVVLQLAEIQASPEKKSTIHSLNQKMVDQPLSPEMKQEIKVFSKLMKKRWAEIHPLKELQLNTSSNTPLESPLKRPVPILNEAKRRRTGNLLPRNDKNISSITTNPSRPPRHRTPKENI